MNNPKKKEDLTPEELWKKVSMQLSLKKTEGSSKSPQASKFDFSANMEEIAKITADRIKEEGKTEFFKAELDNSLRNRPVFTEIQLEYPADKKCKVPSFFPQASFFMFENPLFYKKFDLDTLFFIFYFCKGSVQQAYAASRLKHYAWRYHMKYKMWFQRLDEPKLITTDYEKGDFLFFDYETSWNFMKKNDFVFEYRYLEHFDW